MDFFDEIIRCIIAFPITISNLLLLFYVKKIHLLLIGSLTIYLCSFLLASDAVVALYFGSNINNLLLLCAMSLSAGSSAYVTYKTMKMYSYSQTINPNIQKGSSALGVIGLLGLVCHMIIAQGYQHVFDLYFFSFCIQIYSTLYFKKILVMIVTATGFSLNFLLTVGYIYAAERQHLFNWERFLVLFVLLCSYISHVLNSYQLIKAIRRKVQ